MKRDTEQVSTPPDGKPLWQQPAWRQDFPIDWPQDLYVERRDFMKFMVLTSGAFALGQLCIGVKAGLSRSSPPPEARKIASLSDIPVGGSLTFDYPAAHDSCILLRPDERTLLAYSQKCTHLSCAVIPNHARNCLHCPCHEGNFDMASGRAISGPPRRPLPRVIVELRGEEIYATGVEVRAV